jgi:hypothetical protein
MYRGPRRITSAALRLARPTTDFEYPRRAANRGERGDERTGFAPESVENSMSIRRPALRIDLF